MTTDRHRFCESAASFAQIPAKTNHKPRSGDSTCWRADHSLTCEISAVAASRLSRFCFHACGLTPAARGWHRFAIIDSALAGITQRTSMNQSGNSRRQVLAPVRSFAADLSGRVRRFVLYPVLKDWASCDRAFSPNLLMGFWHGLNWMKRIRRIFFFPALKGWALCAWAFSPNLLGGFSTN